MDGMVAEMHFPLRRLYGEAKFQVWETRCLFHGLLVASEGFGVCSRLPDRTSS